MKRFFALTLSMIALTLSACTTSSLSDASGTANPASQPPVEVVTHTKELEPIQEEEPTQRFITSEHTNYEDFYFRLSDGYAVQCIESQADLSCDWENKVYAPQGFLE